MMIGVLFVLATVGGAAITTEAFTLHGLDGPCHVKVEGKAGEDPPADCAAAIAAASTPKEKAIRYFTWA